MYRFACLFLSAMCFTLAAQSVARAQSSPGLGYGDDDGSDYYAATDDPSGELACEKSTKQAKHDGVAVGDPCQGVCVSALLRCTVHDFSAATPPGSPYLCAGCQG